MRQPLLTVWLQLDMAVSGDSKRKLMEVLLPSKIGVENPVTIAIPTNVCCVSGDTNGLSIMQLLVPIKATPINKANRLHRTSFPSNAITARISKQRVYNGRNVSRWPQSFQYLGHRFLFEFNVFLALGSQVEFVEWRTSGTRLVARTSQGDSLDADVQAEHFPISYTIP